MKSIEYNNLKNRHLKDTRCIGFDDVIDCIQKGLVIDIVQHQSKSHQKIMIIRYNDYVYEVPFVEDDEKYFLKTIYPSRKYNKIYNS